MPSPWLKLRRRLLTPDPRQAELRVRGFVVKNEAARDTLENVGRQFIGGFSDAAGTASPAAAAALLEQRPPAMRGFAYEGAAMAYGVMDGLGLGGGRSVDRFLNGPGADHVYMIHVGAGWALARLPRFRRWSILPAHPLLRWLALDGYGFHQAYFHTARYVHARHRDPAVRWPSDLRAYAPNAVDQGIGRALWFVAGTAPRELIRMLNRFAPRRHADLWSGVGLAASYAGGATTAELTELAEAAGPHRAELAQGSAFAAKARSRAGYVPEHTARATAILCGCSPEQAAEITDRGLIDLTEERSRPAYEVWRRRIADELMLLRS